MDADTTVRVVSKPSNFVESFQRKIVVTDATYDMILVTMKRSFLLVINSGDSGAGDLPGLIPSASEQANVSDEQLIQSFMSETSCLRGLSLAIGGHSTCLVSSENSVASQTLAVRLSKALNRDGPVYVVNNAKASGGTLDPMDNTASLYEKIFQFVRQSYTPSSQ